MKSDNKYKRLIFYKIAQSNFVDSSRNGVGDFKGVTVMKKYFNFLKTDVILFDDILIKYKDKNATKEEIESHNGSLLDFFELTKDLKNERISCGITIDIKNIETVHSNLTNALKIFKNKTIKSDNGESTKTKSFYTFKPENENINIFWRNEYVLGNFKELVEFYNKLGIIYFVFKNTEYLFDIERKEVFNSKTMKQIKELKDIAIKISTDIKIIGQSKLASNKKINELLFDENIFDYFINENIAFEGTKKVKNILTKVKLKPAKLIKRINNFADSPRKILAFNNQGLGRYIERWANTGAYSEDISKTFLATLLMSPSSPLIYYGDELGTHNLAEKDLKIIKSIEHNEKKGKALDDGLSEKQLAYHFGYLHRENLLSFFPFFNNEEEFKFICSNAHVALPKNAPLFNVVKEKNDVYSVLYHFWRILSLTQESIYLHVFQKGKGQIALDPFNRKIFKVKWTYSDTTINFIANFTNKKQKIHVRGNNVISISSQWNKYYSQFPKKLMPYEAIIYSSDNL